MSLSKVFALILVLSTGNGLALELVRDDVTLLGDDAVHSFLGRHPLQAERMQSVT